MVIFHGYVSLPEGNPHEYSFTPTKYEFSKLFAKLSTQRISMYLGVLFFHGFLHGFILPVLPTTRWFFFFPENHVMDFSSDLTRNKAEFRRPPRVLSTVVQINNEQAYNWP